MSDSSSPSQDQFGPESSATTNQGLRIVVDRVLCIGAAPCVAVAPGVFQLDEEEGKAYIVDPNSSDEETIRMAAEACPVLAIKLFKEGKQIYPEK